MTDELTHHGIQGMHWGRRTAKAASTAPSRSRSNNPVFGLHHMTQKVSSYKKMKVDTAENIAKGILLGVGLLTIQGVVSHMMAHPLQVHIDYTRPPFKKAVEPFFKATVKKVVPKLLPGG